MSDALREPSPRYFALDYVRASAMLLGVVYHAVGMGEMFVGAFLNPFAGPPASARLTEWIHHFRMPLFFLISGFFGAMMLRRYGVIRYLTRRWWRIGAPFLVALFAFAGLHILTRPAGFGMGPPPPAPAGEPGTSIPGGFGPPPALGPPGGMAGAGPAGAPASEGPGLGPPPVAFGKAPSGGFGPPPGGGGPGFDPPGGAFPMFRPTPIATRLFGPNAVHFTLGVLWFLWYLLVFVTLAPLVTGAIGLIVRGPVRDGLDRSARWALRWDVAPLALGLVALPAVLAAPGFFGWQLGPAAGVFATFPDGLLQYQADFPLYFLFFLAGWWLYRLRDVGLPGLARAWLPSLAIGTAAYVASVVLSDRYSFQFALPQYGQLRLGAYALYAVGMAYTAAGYLGFAQRFLDRPGPLGRYLADTALWVYLVHQEILFPLLPWTNRIPAPWWVRGLVATIVTTLAALLLYELFVRRTPLRHLFGPPTPRPTPAPPASNEPDPAATPAAPVPAA